MPPTYTVKPTHKPVKEYRATLATFGEHGVEHEQAVRAAFQNLLTATGKKQGWTLIAEDRIKVKGKTVIPDGTFRDGYSMSRGHWEAKDSSDDLEDEIKKKIAKGYPLGNIIFEDTRTGHLYQNGKQTMRADLTDPRQLCDLLNAFYCYTEPAHEDFNKAVDEFKEIVPRLARALVEKIAEAHRDNKRFQEAFDKFFDICRHSLNPNISQAAIDEMLASASVPSAAAYHCLPCPASFVGVRYRAKLSVLAYGDSEDSSWPVTIKPTPSAIAPQRDRPTQAIGATTAYTSGQREQ